MRLMATLGMYDVTPVFNQIDHRSWANFIHNSRANSVDWVSQCIF